MRTTHKHLLLVVALFLGILNSYNTFSQVSESDSNLRDTIKYGANPENCKINLSLYIEFYRQKNLNDAYLPWSNVFRECPKSSKNLYLHGPSILWNKINKIKDQTLKAKYGDTLMLIYDKRIKYFGEEGKVMGRKGLDFYKLYPNKKIEAINMLNQSLQIEGNTSDIAVISAIFQISSELVKEKSLSDEQFFESYNKLSDIISNQIAKKQDSLTQVQLQKVQEKLDAILSLSGKATCENIIPIFSNKFELNKDNISNLKIITKFLNKQKCTDSKLYTEVSEQIYKIEPSASSAYSLALLEVKKGNYVQASTFYLQAIDLESNPENKAQYYYDLALLNGTKLNQNNTARNYAYKAIECKMNWGKPYILIGTLYIQSVKDCGENTLKQSMMYIAAVDKFTQAKTVDPTCTKDANKLISTYSSYFPAKDEAFFNSLKEGDSYTINCWINETIQIRFKKK